MQSVCFREGYGTRDGGGEGTVSSCRMGWVFSCLFPKAERRSKILVATRLRIATVKKQPSCGQGVNALGYSVQ